MDDKPSQPPEIEIGSSNRPGLGSVQIRTTRQEEILMHWVSDGDLTDLAHSRTGRLENFLWAMVGASVGAFIPAMEDLFKAYLATPPQPITALALLKILVFFITAALAILAAGVIYQKEKSGKELLKEIRNRPKFTHEA